MEREKRARKGKVCWGGGRERIKKRGIVEDHSPKGLLIPTRMEREGWEKGEKVNKGVRETRQEMETREKDGRKRERETHFYSL